MHSCRRCGDLFDREHSRQQYCGKKCAKAARADSSKQREETEEDRVRRAASARKAEALRRIRLQQTKTIEADRKLREEEALLQSMSMEAARLGILEESIEDVEWRLEFEEDQARANAANVTALRAREFVQLHKPDLENQLLQWAFNKGLTPFDVEAIWAHLLGNPRPIVVEPEEEELSPLDFLGEDEDEGEGADEFFRAA